ncbi:MAG: electron transfer flavoprotein subunit alpha/FixB family protein [Flavobacteriia bacterium]|nr:electron transfer flavoprotein subunit alpha/FixB family protein [Flavobacteriia bacterium]NBV91060.1 electron transfer flavoprotein subunit alpha/FixB family protein [Flavobacteriia bacterium]NBY39833.1 electron transfer flavoprotein subunit alpha/FixB family protein [Flavobacteriia bacterium]
MTLVYLHTSNGMSKSAFEAVTYAKKLGNEVIVLTAGNADANTLATLGSFGAQKVIVNRAIDGSDEQQVSTWVCNHAANAENILFLHDVAGKAIAPRVSVRLKAGLVAGAVALPEMDQTIKVNVFSGKAFGFVKVNSQKRIISLLANSIAPEKIAEVCPVEEVNETIESSGIKILSTKKPEGNIPLPEAELVVSAGRGLKGPENWGIIDDLASALGAATACSRPVSDIGWRPHHEHVGQTGIAIRPNLYIAIGISGAIQHLAGVNGSKVIVVVNTDKEAPFFKAADYGVLGDAFEVIPRLTEAVKRFKLNQ